MALERYPAEGVPLHNNKYSQLHNQPGSPVTPGAPGAPGDPVPMEFTTVTITPEPRDHVVWSLASFFYANICCLGLAALICSIKARDRKRVGDMGGARHHGSTAFILNTVVAVLFCVLVVVTIVLYVYEPFYGGFITGYMLRKI